MSTSQRFICASWIRWTTALVGLSGLLMVTACLPSREAPLAPTPTFTSADSFTAAEDGDTLRMLSPDAPTLLNPHLSVAGRDQEASRITYEPLASFDRDGKLVPFLAAEIPSLANGDVSPDGQSVTWKLKQNVLWSDGQPFTAEDVLFTYQYASNPKVKATTTAIYSAIQNVEVLDPYTVKIRFKYPTLAWYQPFVGIRGVILPRHVFELYNGENARQAPANTLPVGTGPYRVMPPGIKPQEVLLLGSQLIKTNKIVFEPNPYFRYPDKPYFRQVILQGGGLASDAANQVVQGSLDVAYVRGQLSPEVAQELQGSSHGRLVTVFGTVVERLALNRTDPNQATEDGERSSLQFPHPIFQDKKVRQAFAYAIDRERIAKEVYGVSGRPVTNNLVAPPEYASSKVFYTYDLKKAAALLDEAGWVDHDGDGVREKDGRDLKVVYQTFIGQAVQATQKLIQESLEKIGVGVELKIVDSTIMFGLGATYPDSEYRFNADLQEFSIGSPSIDPAIYMAHWTCARIPQKSNDWAAGLNVERWCNPEYDALYQQAVTELNPAVRQQVIIRMNDLLVEDVVMIPLVVIPYTQAVVAPSIEGMDLTPWDTSTWNIMDWKRSTP